jgi:hypothetical protein
MKSSGRGLRQEPRSPLCSGDDADQGLPGIRGVCRDHVVSALIVQKPLRPTERGRALLEVTHQAIFHLPFSNMKHFISVWHCTVPVSLNCRLA